MTRKSTARRVSRNASATQSEPQAAPALSKVTNICLSQLVLSPANVRKTPATEAEDAEFEASIRAKGILQNLIVHATDGDGVYQVDAGGRRSGSCRSSRPKASLMPITRFTARSSSPKTQSNPRWPRTRSARRCIRPTSSSLWRR